jgi:hypothetical protein
MMRTNVSVLIRFPIMNAVGRVEKFHSMQQRGRFRYMQRMRPGVIYPVRNSPGAVLFIDESAMIEPPDKSVY